MKPVYFLMNGIIITKIFYKIICISMDPPDSRSSTEFISTLSAIDCSTSGSSSPPTENNVLHSSSSRAYIHFLKSHHEPLIKAGELNLTLKATCLQYGTICA